MKIAMALGADAWGGISSESLEKGIGGREGALIRLSMEWAKMGHEVTNFVPTKKAERIYPGGDIGFYEFVPFDMARTCMSTFPYDACVAWECPLLFAHDRVVEKNPVRLVEMQCAHLDPLSTDAAAEYSTGVIGLSQWHVDYLAWEGIEGPFFVLPNGVDLRNYPWTERKDLPRNRNFFYSSSPDRGLLHVLEAWQEIRSRWPSATLKVGYGATKWLSWASWSHRGEGQMAIDMARLLKQDGVEDVGQISQTELAKIQRASTMLTYPADTIQHTETGCITVIEAMAAGAPVVTTDADCLAEEFSDNAMIVPLPFRTEKYVDAMESVLTDKDLYLELRNGGREFAESRQWSLIAPRWIELFEEQKSLLS